MAFLEILFICCLGQYGSFLMCTLYAVQMTFSCSHLKCKKSVTKRGKRTEYGQNEHNLTFCTTRLHKLFFLTLQSLCNRYDCCMSPGVAAGKRLRSGPPQLISSQI